MSKTPEEIAKLYDDMIVSKDSFVAGYNAGYQAAKDEYKVAIDTYNDVAKQMLEEAVRIMSPQNQLADAGKVMNSPEKQDSCEHILDMEKMVDVNCSINSNGWISVKDRLPNLEKTSRSLRRESSCILLVSYGNVYAAHLCEDWSDRSLFIFEACACNCRAFDMETDEWKLDQVTHWMPLPKPPEDK